MVIAAALLHAVWNAVVKIQGDLHLADGPEAADAVRSIRGIPAVEATPQGAQGDVLRGFASPGGARGGSENCALARPFLAAA